LETLVLVLWGTGLISTGIGAAFFFYTKSRVKEDTQLWQREKEAAVRERLLFHGNAPDPPKPDAHMYDFSFGLSKMFGGIGILLPIISMLLVLFSA